MITSEIQFDNLESKENPASTILFGPSMNLEREDKISIYHVDALQLGPNYVVVFTGSFTNLERGDSFIEEEKERGEADVSHAD